MKIWATIASVALLVGATGGTAYAVDPLKIGAVNPYSGPLAVFGDEVARGYELAADAVNGKGGVLGRPVQIVRGDAGNPQQGISIIEKLVAQDKVELFVGTYVSAVSNAASDAAARYGKTYWETHALAADLTERGLPNFIRSGPNGRAFAAESVEGALKVIAPKLGRSAGELKVWIEHEDTIYGTSIAQVQKQLFEAAGARVVGVGSHSYRAIDLTDAILRAVNAKPDLWVATGYVPDNTLLLRTMRDQGFTPPAVMLLGTGDGPEFHDALGDFMDGIFVVGYPHADLPESYAPGAAAFVAAYKAKYRRDAGAPQSVEAYAMALALFDTIEAAGSTDMARLRAAAAAMDKPAHTYPNGFGMKFDDKMQNTRATPNIVQWQQGGRTVTVYPVEAQMPGAVVINLPRKS